MNEIYKENGFKSRMDYLYSLADEYDVDIETVHALASVLGKDEDFDGLVSSLEDHCGCSDFDGEDEMFAI